MAENALTPQYIQSHLGGVHTAESWGRSITEQVLKTAQGQMKSGKVREGDSATVDVKFTISTVEKPTCIVICADIAGHLVCWYPCWAFQVGQKI